METKYFKNAFYYDNNMVVTKLDKDENYRTCLNLAKAASFTDCMNFDNFNTTTFDLLTSSCEKPKSYGRGDNIKKYCKDLAQDNDYDYVTCLRQNNVNYRMDPKKVSRPPEKKIPDTLNDEFVINEKIFPPNLTSFSCRDTVEGFCREDLTLKQCVNLCDAYDNCSYGYYLKKGEKSYCYPLYENIFNLREKNCLHFLSYDVSEFSFPISGNIFYRKNLNLSDNPSSNFATFFLGYNNLYLQSDCSFGSNETAVQLKFINTNTQNFLPENNQLYSIINAVTFEILVYDIGKKYFTFQPGFMAKMNNFIALQDTNLFFLFIVQKDPDNLYKFLHIIGSKLQYIGVYNNTLTFSPDIFRFNLKKIPSDIDKIQLSDFDSYYEKFFPKPKSLLPTIIFCISVGLIVILLLYIFL